MSVRVSAIAALTLAFLAAPAASQAADVELVVRRDPGLTAAERADVRADAGVRYERPVRLADTEVVSVPADQAAKALSELRSDRDVRWAMRNDGVHATAAAGADAYWNQLWGLQNTGQTLHVDHNSYTGTDDADMDVPEAWSTATGSGVTVAVVDTGALFTHPDLQGQFATNPGEGGAKSANAVDDDHDGLADDWRGWDFVSRDNYPSDDQGHGTHVTGTIAALNGGGQGGTGVAPDARVLPLKVLDNTGSGTAEDVANAFDLAGDMGIRIVNASLGAYGDAPAITDAIAQHPNTLYVVAAGNDGRDLETTTFSPCEAPLPNVLCVGASDQRDARAGFSNYGSSAVDLYAPGVNILSTYLGNQYSYMSGTSMATPDTAGVAALVLSHDPSLSAQALKAALMLSAEPKPGLVSVSGGRVNAQLALAGLTTDGDGDGLLDVVDYCPHAGNAAQIDTDGDGQGDDCDSTPRGDDADRDGIPALDDQCPSSPGPASNHGCPVPVAPPASPPPASPPPTAPPTSPPPATPRDDTPPAPPRVRSIKVTIRSGVVTVRVTLSRSATVHVTAQRRACSHGRCAWKSARTASASRTGPVKLRLKPGRYRLKVSAAKGAARYKTITVRR